LGDRGASPRAGIVVLDRDGVVRWTNQPWSGVETGVPFGAGAGEGSNLLALAANEPGPLAGAIAAAIAAVIARTTDYVEMHYQGVPGRPMTIAITPARSAGAVLFYVESGARSAAEEAPEIHATNIAERLTPREREVLTRITEGRSNREIATLLGIEYTTVRGHVQAVLAKLGARSRVDAVAAAYRGGLVREADLVSDRESGPGRRDKPADEISGRRESEVM
jgi:DNA-binding CsgD family transcriptional regulator